MFFRAYPRRECEAWKWHHLPRWGLCKPTQILTLTQSRAPKRAPRIWGQIHAPLHPSSAPFSPGRSVTRSSNYPVMTKRSASLGVKMRTNVPLKFGHSARETAGKASTMAHTPQCTEEITMRLGEVEYLLCSRKKVNCPAI
jgi:hypothetical protein